YEFRDLIGRTPGDLTNTLRQSSWAAFNFPPEVTDMYEVASRSDQGDLWVKIETSGYGRTTDPAIRPTSLIIRVRRGQNIYHSDVYVDEKRIEFDDSGISGSADYRFEQGSRRVDL